MPADTKTQERLDAAEAVIEAIRMFDKATIPETRFDAVALFATNLEYFIRRSQQEWVG